IAQRVDGLGAHLVTAGDVVEADERHAKESEPGAKKSEIRNPKSERSPKSEVRKHPGLNSDCRGPAGRRFPEFARQTVLGVSISDFGIRVSFGLRISDFGFGASVAHLDHGSFFRSLSLGIAPDAGPFLTFFPSARSRLIAR